jgi:hypothetical protein
MGPFKIERWQKAVKYKHALTPLSVRGSLIEPGGRFNIGGTDTRFSSFPVTAQVFFPSPLRGEGGPKDRVRV